MHACSSFIQDTVEFAELGVLRSSGKSADRTLFRWVGVDQQIPTCISFRLAGAEEKQGSGSGSRAGAGDGIHKM